MKKNIKIVFNSPVVITFTVICFIVTVLGIITGDLTNRLFFSVYRASLADPLTYFRFIGHVFGHVGFEHFIGNTMLLLLIGPLLEEKYGSKKIVFIIAATAIVTGIIQFIFFGGMLLGASGVVFAFILLSSITSLKGDGIPVTFILVTVLYIGGEVFSGIFESDNVSQITHIVGGIVGAFIGFGISKQKNKFDGNANKFK